jgi:DNA-binding beta-propeller fold protein YncE
VAFVLSHAMTTSDALFALVTRGAVLCSVPLAGIELGPYRWSDRGRPVRWSSAGLAVGPSGDRAYVIGAGPVVAEVDLQTLSVSYHEVPDLPSLGSAFHRSAAWFGDRYVAIFGEAFDDDASAPTTTPAGISLVDTTTWHVETLESRASMAIVSAGLLLAFGGTLQGVEGFAPDFRRWTLNAEDTERLGSVLSVYPAGDQVFVVSRDGQAPRVSAIDVKTGRVMASTQLGPLINLVSSAP